MNLLEVSVFTMKRTYLLVGLTGAGKSTIGNCILNKSGDLEKINNYPFITSNSASGCTYNFKIENKGDYTVIKSILLMVLF